MRRIQRHIGPKHQRKDFMVAVQPIGEPPLHRQRVMGQNHFSPPGQRDADGFRRRIKAHGEAVDILPCGSDLNTRLIPRRGDRERCRPFNERNEFRLFHASNSSVLPNRRILAVVDWVLAQVPDSVRKECGSGHGDFPARPAGMVGGVVERFGVRHQA